MCAGLFVVFWLLFLQFFDLVAGFHICRKGQVSSEVGAGEVLWSESDRVPRVVASDGVLFGEHVGVFFNGQNACFIVQVVYVRHVVATCCDT